jgi:hypothetical protein
MPLSFKSERSRNETDWSRLASLFFLATGLVLRLVQYGGNTSQWLDETMLSTSIVNRTLIALLTTPLAYQQTAPPGLLLVEKLTVSAFGVSDLSLRLFPLLSAIVSLFVFLSICNRVLDGISRPIAMAMMATAAPFIISAGQVKQYSSDVMVALVVLLLGLDIQRPVLTRKRAIWVAGTGACAAWLSQPAVFVLAGVSMVLLWIAWSDHSSDPDKLQRFLLPVICVWGVSSLASTIVSWTNTPLAVRAMLHSYWSGHFMPMPPWRAPTVFLWAARELDGLLGSRAIMSLLYPAPKVYVGLMLLGIWTMWRTMPRATALLLAPIALTFLGAAAQQYPFSDRLILFLVPIFILAIAKGLGVVTRLAAHWSKAAGAAVLALGSAPLLYPVVASPPPYQVENIKPVLDYVRSQHISGDRIYVYNSALPAFTYYASDYGFRPDEYSPGLSHHCQNRLYLADLDVFRGTPRFWIILTHAPVYGERHDMLQYLDAIGIRRLEFVAAAHRPARTPQEMLEPADAYLYDLSDAKRARAASSDTFPVTQTQIDQQFACDPSE